MFGRIANRERSVVVLFATDKVARERQSVRENDFKLVLFAVSSRRVQTVATVDIADPEKPACAVDEKRWDR
jgi:hypothetical protein